MNKHFLDQINEFTLIRVTRYLEVEIQKCALSHLELRDMGQLRDMMEGEAYYNKLRVDILAEFAFEKIIGINNFDWKKRETKGYKRKHYNFDNHTLKLVSFTGSSLPKISLKHLSNFVFVYVNPELKIYVSGLLKLKTLENEFHKGNDLSLMNSSIIDFYKFNELLHFSNFDELKQILN